MPSSVRELILRRLERLIPADRRVLDLIAVMGDATSHALLRATSSLDEETLLEAMQRLRAAGFVAEGIDGSDVVYSVTHPLIQEVAYAELPEMARRRAHLAAIEALEFFSEGRPDDTSVLPSEGSGQVLSRLARHYRGAGPEADSGRALAVLLAAGERAHTLYANEEAARHFDAALAMVRQGQSVSSFAGRDELLLPWVLERLGEAWERIGKREAAIQVWNEALVLLLEGRERAADAVAASRLHRQLARAEWDHGHFDAANAHLEARLESALQGSVPAGLALADMPTGMMLLAEAQVAAGSPESALDTARKLVMLGPSNNRRSRVWLPRA